ncbi:site-specific DNA-methyltransferase [Lactiplantibacillus paraplantarum]|uniref:site-specific DNA-methyltransferase n=1 Tax=Lactiplantibacillus paraplantarum TaxID=60520 RepID=UPI000E73F3CF|nr:site-specific DNA-methyltransferase [Lactiplantibacillus paraplantarum]RKD21496.1 hypothetical protein BG617_15235 [Lactiplantibacillus paraplantarum]
MDLHKMNGQSVDMHEQDVRALKELFPEAFTERGKLDFDKLQAVLRSGDLLEELDDEGKYEFSWWGKQKAMRNAKAPVTETLRPSFERSVNWETSENLYIEGDNLTSSKLLQKSYANKVRLIYLDPPYNTGSDFIYNDDYSLEEKEYLIQTGQIDAAGYPTTTNNESNGRFHSDWLNMMYPRLKVLRNLLTDDGVIVVSIDDKEVVNLRKVMDEVFGESSFVTTILVELSTTQGMKVGAAKNGNIVKNGEYLVVYTKDGHKNIAKRPMLNATDYDGHYNTFLVQNDDGSYSQKQLAEKISENQDIVEQLQILNLTKGKLSNSKISQYYSASNLAKDFIDKNAEFIVRDHSSIDIKDFDIEEDGKVYEYKSESRNYLVQKHKGKFTQKIKFSDKLALSDDFKPVYGPTKIRGDWWKEFYLDMGNVSKEGGVEYKNGKKPVRLIKQLIEMLTESDDYILDAFSGSGTTAHATLAINEEQGSNRKFILMQTPDVIKPKENNYKLGFRTLTELAEKRISNVINEINPALGFKVFYVDTTNITAWNAEMANSEQGQLLFSEDNIVNGRSDMDVLYEILLKKGLDLNLPLSEINDEEFTLFDVGFGALYVVMGTSVTRNAAVMISKARQNYENEGMFITSNVVFVDNSFKSAEEKLASIDLLKASGFDDDEIESL